MLREPLEAVRPQAMPSLYRFGEFVLDVEEASLVRNGVPVRLTPKALDVLRVLVSHRGRLVTKEALNKEIWPDTIVEEGNLAFHVSAVRKVLQTAGDAEYIETIPKRGYRFVMPVVEIDRPVREAKPTGNVEEPTDQAGRSVRLRSVRFWAAAAAILAVAAISWAVVARGDDAGATAPAGVDAADAPNPEVYALYRQARQAWSARTPEQVRKAITLFEQAVAIDPSFAPAHAGLAHAYAITMSGLAPQHRFPLAGAATVRALALDETLVDAHTALGFIKYKWEWDWSGAERAFRRAIELNPGDIQAHHWFGEYLSQLGRHEEALALLERALALAPSSVPIQRDLARALYFARRYDDAIKGCEAVVAVEPKDWRCHFYASHAIEGLGLHQQAAERDLVHLGLRGVPPASIAALESALRTGGAPEYWQVQLALRRDGRLADLGQPYDSPYEFAVLHARVGEVDAAVTWLARSYDRRDDGPLLMNMDPRVDALRGDPRFEALLRQVGMP